MTTVSGAPIAALLGNGSVFDVSPQRQTASGDAPDVAATDEFRQTPAGSKRAAQMLRQEIFLRFRLRFASTFSVRQSTAAGYPRGDDADDVAQEVLQSARTIADAAGRERAPAVEAMRGDVAAAAKSSATAVDSDDEAETIRTTERALQQGLDDIERTPPRDTYSALELNARSKQRTSIRIRTQEGDVVRFDLRQVDRVSLSDVAVDNPNGSARVTELEVSSDSRLVLRVRGDLNEAEMEAIRSVFAKAEQLADEFFSGDMNAALEIAAGLEFDSEQLARVSMRFRSVEQVRATQITQSIPPADSAPAFSPTPVTEDAPLVEPGFRAAPVPAGALPVEKHSPAELTDAPAKAAEPSSATVAEPLGVFASLASYLERLAEFLEQTAADLGRGLAIDGEGSRFRFESRQSLQMEILRVVMTVKAPEIADDDADRGEMIRALDGAHDNDD